MFSTFWYCWRKAILLFVTGKEANFLEVSSISCLTLTSSWPMKAVIPSSSAREYIRLSMEEDAEDVSNGSADRKKRRSPEESGIYYDESCRTCKTWITE
nr:hypothetical protein [Tanacetum cinerariifolium]